MPSGAAGPCPGRIIHRIRQTRECLKCHQNFESTGIGNRMCSRCQKSNEEILQREKIS